MANNYRSSVGLAANMDQAKENRPLESYVTTAWGDRFMSFSFDHTEYESLSNKVEELKEDVKKTMIDYEDDLIKKIHLIDSLCRLGVSYHLEKEIEEQLEKTFQTQKNLLEEYNYDLYTTGVMFRVFRQHGYNISSCIFEKFKGEDKKFKDMLGSDIMGMLSLYEASYLGIKGEQIVDEALAFTTSHLESLVSKTSPSLSRRISEALKLPLHKGIQRVEARKYVDFYESLDNANEMLVKFAKLDFNRVRLVHLKELQILSNWWKDLKIVESLPYGRGDRLVEMYSWTIGVYAEPRYSHARVILAKQFIIWTVIDDTYDTYGTLEELEIFTNAILRWDIDLVDQLPNYMKIIYTVTIDTYNQFDEDVKDKGRTYCVAHAISEIKKVAIAYLTEAKWCRGGVVPKFEEYMVIGGITCGMEGMGSTAMIGMDDIAGVKEYQWLDSRPKLMVIMATIGRYMDDIATHEAEMKRGIICSIPCYMEEYNVPKVEVVSKYHDWIRDGWKDINEEMMRPDTVSVRFRTRMFNLMRVLQVVYGNGIDGVSHPDSMKDSISSLVDPLIL